MTNPVLSHPLLSAEAIPFVRGVARDRVRGIWSQRPEESDGFEAPTSLTFHSPLLLEGVAASEIQIADPVSGRLYDVLSTEERVMNRNALLTWSSCLYHLRDTGRIYAPEGAVYTAVAPTDLFTAEDFIRGETGRSTATRTVRFARFAGAHFAAIAYPSALGAITSFMIEPGSFLNQVHALNRKPDTIAIYGEDCAVYVTDDVVFAEALSGGEARVEITP